jgi:iduronate 2-sulfatase
MIRVPGVSPGGRTAEAPVESLDIYPMLCELCGLDIPKNVDGASLVPLIKNPDLPGKKYACGYYKKGDFLAQTMRTERYRIVHWTDLDNKTVQVEFYDHETDPDETENIADRHPDLVKKLMAQMQAVNTLKKKN